MRSTTPALRPPASTLRSRSWSTGASTPVENTGTRAWWRRDPIATDTVHEHLGRDTISLRLPSHPPRPGNGRWWWHRSEADPGGEGGGRYHPVHRGAHARTGAPEPAGQGVLAVIESLSCDLRRTPVGVGRTPSFAGVRGQGTPSRLAGTVVGLYPHRFLVLLTRRVGSGLLTATASPTPESPGSRPARPPSARVPGEQRREAHLPAEQPSPLEAPRLPSPHERPERSGHRAGPAPEGSEAAVRLIWRVRGTEAFAGFRRGHRGRTVRSPSSSYPAPPVVTGVSPRGLPSPSAARSARP